MCKQTTLDPRLLEILRCPDTRKRLKVTGDYLTTGDGENRYPIVSGIPLLFSKSASITHSGSVSLQQDNLRIAAEGDGFDDDSIDKFITAMLVPTCGNLFHGSSLNGDYPIASLPLGLAKGYVLDVGCNWGRWSIGGAMSGHDVIGIDPHLGALLTAKALSRRLVPENPPLFVACDARHLPFGRDSFGSAYSYSVLQHFSRSNMVRILDEIRRVLSEGGISEIQMPNRWGLKAMFDRLCGRTPPDEEFNVRYNSIPDLIRCFTEHVGPSEYRVDCFLGLNVHVRDRRFVSGFRKIVIDVSALLGSAATPFPPLKRLADSVFIRSKKSSAVAV